MTISVNKCATCLARKLRVRGFTMTSMRTQGEERRGRTEGWKRIGKRGEMRDNAREEP